MMLMHRNPYNYLEGEMSLSSFREMKERKIVVVSFVVDVFLIMNC